MQVCLCTETLIVVIVVFLYYIIFFNELAFLFFNKDAVQLIFGQFHRTVIICAHVLM